MQSNIYYIPHARTCELAHQLTLKELTDKGKEHEIDIIPEDGDGSYIPYVQAIFDDYVNMIENIMLNDEIHNNIIDEQIGYEKTCLEQYDTDLKNIWSKEEQIAYIKGMEYMRDIINK